VEQKRYEGCFEHEANQVSACYSIGKRVGESIIFLIRSNYEPGQQMAEGGGDSQVPTEQFSVRHQKPTSK
jgi:hypothetical protein